MRISPYFFTLKGGITIKYKSRITGELYEGDDMVYLMLTNQAGLYMKNGAELLDCFWHEKRNCLCFVFNREKTKSLYELWDKHELK